MMSKGTVILFLWLIIGAAAAGQRGYFSTPNLGCTQGATMALTIVAGPLNYVGLDPKISCTTPKPGAPCPPPPPAPPPPNTTSPATPISIFAHGTCGSRINVDSYLLLMKVTTTIPGFPPGAPSGRGGISWTCRTAGGCCPALLRNSARWVLDICRHSALDLGALGSGARRLDLHGLYGRLSCLLVAGPPATAPPLRQAVPARRRRSDNFGRRPGHQSSHLDLVALA